MRREPRGRQADAGEVKSAPGRRGSRQDGGRPVLGIGDTGSKAEAPGESD